jgi:hypothetical protein
MSEFATRFRTAVADLKAEGVTLPSSELGWFLKEKSGLDPLRKQLLETALQGQEEYEQIERESLRLFRDLHLSDPLFRRMGDRNDGNKPKLTIRRMFGQPSSAGSSSSASVSSFRTLSDASRRSGSSTPAKRVYLTEVPEDPVDEEAPEEEELVEDDEHMVLETAIQKEAQAFAAELEEAEQDGLDPSTIETLEANFESAAETLVTMREVKLAIDCKKSERIVATRSPWMVLQRVDRFPRRIRSIHASIVVCRGTGPVTKSVRSLAKDLLAKLEKLQLLPSKCVLRKFVNRTPLPLTPLTQPALYTKLPW